jgi:hypothetical protein
VTDFVDEFYSVYGAWKADTAHLSSIDAAVQSDHFKELVALGDKVVPLIVYELKKAPSFIFLALHEITGENPVPPSARGKVREMANAWISWAENTQIDDQ